MPKYLNKLEGKRVVVLGGTSGIGFCVAEAAIEYGAFVTVSSSSPEKVDRAAERLRALYPNSAERVLGFPCDIGQSDKIKANVEALFKKATNNGAHKINHIVCTAGQPGGV